MQRKDDLGASNKRLKAVMGDIEVTTMILKSTDCGAKKFLQLENPDELDMLKCQNECTNATIIAFSHESLQKKIDQLASPAAQQLINRAFSDFLDESDTESLTLTMTSLTTTVMVTAEKDYLCKAET